MAASLDHTFHAAHQRRADFVRDAKVRGGCERAIISVVAGGLSWWLPFLSRFSVVFCMPDPTGPNQFLWLDLRREISGAHRLHHRSAQQGDTLCRHRHRLADPHLLAGIHGEGGWQVPLLCRPVALHVLDDRHRPREQLRDDVHLLGTGRRQLLHPHRPLVHQKLRRRPPRTRLSSPTASATLGSCSASSSSGSRAAPSMFDKILSARPNPHLGAPVWLYTRRALRFLRRCGQIRPVPAARLAA